MRYLVTGSSGHLGEGLMRTLREHGHEARGIDLLDSPFTTHVGSIADAEFVARCARGVDWILHAATLHKPHIATHSRAAFVETNVAGTLNVLEAAVRHGTAGVVFSSTTSTFGGALRPAADEPAAWITEDVACMPRNNYWVTKKAAEDLCELYHRSRDLPCIVLRLARFFPETDDDRAMRNRYEDLNLKVNEYLHRRLDLADAVEAHLLAAARAGDIGFGRYILSATTPFEPEHLAELRADTPAIVSELFPEYEEVYRQRGWRMLPSIDRVYVNRRAREELGWQPKVDFARALEAVRRGDEVFSPLARAVGAKGYHSEVFDDGPYPVEESG